MAGVAHLRRMLQAYEQGAITDAALPVEIICKLTPEDIQEFVTFAPTDLLDTLKREAAAASRTDAQWDQFIIAVGGTFAFRDAESYQRAMSEIKAQYRRGIEALRTHFGIT